MASWFLCEEAKLSGIQLFSAMGSVSGLLVEEWYDRLVKINQV
jgi:hypothetical protein